MMLKPGKLTNVINILLNISRSKGNQKINFSQLVQHNMTNIFLDKSYIKCDEESIPRPFSKNSKLSISLDLYPKVLLGLFLLFAELRVIEIN